MAVAVQRTWPILNKKGFVFMVSFFSSWRRFQICRPTPLITIVMTTIPQIFLNQSAIPGRDSGVTRWVAADAPNKPPKIIVITSSFGSEFDFLAAHNAGSFISVQQATVTFLLGITSANPLPACWLYCSLDFATVSCCASFSAGYWQLNFSQIVLRIALENHPRTFDVHLASWEHDFRFQLFSVFQNFRVTAAQLLIDRKSTR